MVHPHNPGSTLRILLKLLHTEKGLYVDESNINGYYQKKLFGKNGPFWAKKWHISITLYWPKIFLKNFHKERGQ